jgi:hypothetical protein
MIPQLRRKAATSKCLSYFWINYFKTLRQKFNPPATVSHKETLPARPVILGVSPIECGQAVAFFLR